MTGTEIRDYARRLARMTDLAAPDTHVNTLINEGIKAFAVDVFGLPLRSYPVLAAKFDLRTTMGFNLTITGSANNNIAATDICVTSADADDQTGAQVATMLQAQIRAAIGVGADLTVTWANYKFTVDSITAASVVTIAAPVATYADATDRLFGGTGTATVHYIGNFPENCTWYISLPDGCQNVERVYWNDVELTAVSRDLVTGEESSGDPTCFNIRGDKIYFLPSPSSQGDCYLEYKGVPTDMTTFTAEISTIPDVNQKAVVNWVASELLKEQYDEQLAMARYRDYLLNKARYVNSVYNRDTLGRYNPQRAAYRVPKVVV
jgi:hypothetical protein